MNKDLLEINDPNVVADTPTTKDLTTEQGRSGTLIFNGLITMEEYNRDLTGVFGLQKYDIMRRSDSTVRGTLQIVKLPVLSTTWEVKPAEVDGVTSQTAKDKAAFVQRELFSRNINWQHFLREALTMLDFGFSVFEKVYEPTMFNGHEMIGLAKLASRKQKSIYAWETKDGKPGVIQYVGAFSASIMREKLIVFTHDKEGDNYAGTSLLRYVYRDWDIKDKLTIVNAMALEKLGVGVPIVSEKEGQTATPQDRGEAKSALANMRANQKAYLEIPNTLQVEMLDLKGNTTKDVIPTLNYHDSRIMKSILAGFMEIGGSSGSGSHSLSKDLSSLFMKSEEALANMVMATITEDLVKQLCDLNFADMSEGYPQLMFGQIADDDYTVLSTALAGLATAGLITADAEVEDHLRNVFRLPAMSKEQKDNYDEDHKDPVPVPVDPAAVDPPKDLTKKTDKPVNTSIKEAERYRRQLIGMLAEG